MDFTPCSPYCPGVTGIPELECSKCHSLFHPKCVGIAQARVQALARSFRCKVPLYSYVNIPLPDTNHLFQMCSGRTTATGASVQVIDLD